MFFVPFCVQNQLRYGGLLRRNAAIVPGTPSAPA
jgi:hypothetical protein